MQDDFRIGTQSVPFLSRVPGIGELFKNRDNQYVKSELVIFLRPTVIRNASLEADLKEFRLYLDRQQNLNLAK